MVANGANRVCLRAVVGLMVMNVFVTLVTAYRVVRKVITFISISALSTLIVVVFIPTWLVEGEMDRTRVSFSVSLTECVSRILLEFSAGVGVTRNAVVGVSSGRVSRVSLVDSVVLDAFSVAVGDDVGEDGSIIMDSAAIVRV